MAETRLHEVIDALVTLARAALDDDLVLVCDGYPSSGADGGTVLLVGADDPLDELRADSGEATRDFALASGRGMNEAGTVRCAVTTYDGAGDAKTARDAAVAVLDTVAAAVRGTAPTYFNLPNIWRAAVTDVRLYQDQAEDGATALLMFTVTYAARV